MHSPVDSALPTWRLYGGESRQTAAGSSFRVPTVGLQTIRTMHEAGGRVLAVENDATIMLDQADVIQLADKLGIAIVSLNAEEIRLRLAS